MRKWQQWLLIGGLFVLALALRLGAVWGDNSAPESDESTYDKYAWSFALNEVREEKGLYIYHPLGSFTYRPPGYPLFAGLIYRAVGHSYLAVRLAQALLGALTCVLVYLIGARSSLGAGAGLAAGLICAVYGLMVQSTSLLLSEPLFMLLMCGMLWALVEARRAQAEAGAPWRARGWLAAAGLCAGLSAITRPIGLAVVGAIGVVALPIWFRPAWLKQAAVLALGVLLAVGPIMVKNYEIQHEFVLISTHGGITFWRGVLQAKAEFPAEFEGLRDRIGELPEMEQQRIYYRESFAYLRAHPEIIPSMFSVKAQQLFLDTTFTIAHQPLDVGGEPYAWALILGGGVLGYLVRPRRNGYVLALLGLTLAVQVAVTLLFDSGIRYRIPLVPVLALTAASLAAEIVTWGRGRFRRRPVVAAVSRPDRNTPIPPPVARRRGDRFLHPERGQGGAYSPAKASPTSARHRSRAAILPRLSAQLMHGAAACRAGM
jgi:hypothetical protein